MKNKKTIENITTRVDPKFKKEMIEIKEARIKKGLDKNKKSDRSITKMIIKHNSWPIIKRDLIDIDMDKENGE